MDKPEFRLLYDGKIKCTDARIFNELRNMVQGLRHKFRDSGVDKLAKSKSLRGRFKERLNDYLKTFVMPKSIDMSVWNGD
jgi:hypothetical protein